MEKGLFMCRRHLTTLEADAHKKLSDSKDKTRAALKLTNQWRQECGLMEISLLWYSTAKNASYVQKNQTSTLNKHTC